MYKIKNICESGIIQNTDLKLIEKLYSHPTNHRRFHSQKRILIEKNNRAATVIQRKWREFLKLKRILITKLNDREIDDQSTKEEESGEDDSHLITLQKYLRGYLAFIKYKRRLQIAKLNANARYFDNIRKRMEIQACHTISVGILFLKQRKNDKKIKKIQREIKIKQIQEENERRKQQEDIKSLLDSKKNSNIFARTSMYGTRKSGVRASTIATSMNQQTLLANFLVNDSKRSSNSNRGSGVDPNCTNGLRKSGVGRNSLKNSQIIAIQHPARKSK